MRSYTFARGLFSLLGFMAVCLFVFGLAVALLGVQFAAAYWPFDPEFRWLALMFGPVPGLWLTMYGGLTLAAIQDARATVDTAEYSQQMLQVAREHLDVSRQVQRRAEDARHAYAAPHPEPRPEPAAPASGGYAALAASTSAPDSAPERTIDYRGHTVRLHAEGFGFSGQDFPTLEAVTAFIDGLDGTAKPALRATRTV